MQLVNQHPDDRDGLGQVSAPGAEGKGTKRASFRPLLSLRPYLLSHKGMLAAALIALVVSAAATLAVPLAVRRWVTSL